MQFANPLATVSAVAMMLDHLGEQEAADTGRLSRLRQVDRGGPVDLAREVGIQVAQRIVGQPGQVDDRVEARQVVRVRVADVAVQRGNRWRRGAERASGEQVDVHPDDVVPRLDQHRDNDAADIARMAGDEDALSGHAQTFQGGLPPRQCSSRIARSWMVSTHIQKDVCL